MVYGIIVKDEFERFVLELDLSTADIPETEVLRLIEKTDLIRAFHKQSGTLIGEFQKIENKK